MRRSWQDVLVHGVVAGFLAGLIVALWFLGVDLVAGSPLRTPLELAGVLLGVSERTGTLPLLAAYSILHFAAFGVLGIATAGFLAVANLRPGWLVGLVFGIAVLNGVHYGSLLVTGSDALAVLPWPHVVGANLLAGIGLMTYLHRATRVAGPLGPAVLRRQPVVAEGIVTGLVGAAVVALWFFGIDIGSGQPLHTPAALGSALFFGAEGVSEVRVTAGIVAAYTAFHVAAFAAVGILLTWAASALERSPSLTYLAVLAFIVIEAVSFGALVALGDWVVGALSLWAIGIGNLLGVAGMAWWIWRSRPVLRRRVAEEGFSSAA